MAGLSTVERLLLLWIGGTILLRGVVIALNPGILDFWAFDFEAYWLAAQRLVSGEPIYGTDGAADIIGAGVFRYPPVAVLPFVSLAGFPLLPASTAFVFVNLAAVVITARACAALFAALAGRRPSRVEWLWGVAALETSGVLDSAIALGSVSVLLAGCIAAAGLGMVKGHPRAAGLAIGAAALLKIGPGGLALWAAGRPGVPRRAAVIGLGLVGGVVAVSFALPPFREAWLSYPGYLASMAASGPAHQGNMALASVAEPLLGSGATWLGVAVAASELVVVAVEARRMSVAGGLLAASAASLLVLPALWNHGFLLLVPGIVAVWAAHPALRPMLTATVAIGWAGLAVQADAIGLATVMALTMIGLVTRRALEGSPAPGAQPRYAMADSTDR